MYGMHVFSVNVYACMFCAYTAIVLRYVFLWLNYFSFNDLLIFCYFVNDG